MSLRLPTTAAGQGRELWPLLSLLLLAVILPTVCVLWFMTQAAGNAEMAVRQRLVDFYGRELQAIRTELETEWSVRAQRLGEGEDEAAGRRFERLVTSGMAESVLVFGQDRQRLYPVAPSGEGRLQESSAQLFVLQSAANRSDQEWVRNLESLSARLKDYGEPLMPSAQRLFLMQEVEALGGPAFPTRRAEEWAIVCLERAKGDPQSSALTAAVSNELWWIASPSGRTVGLYTQGGITNIGRAVTGARIELVSAGSAGEAFLSQSAGSFLPGWDLRLFLEGEDPFTAAAEKQVTAYFWTAVLVVAMIALLAALTARHLLRQNRLTRLKNDFVATVSHELKTPVASVRVLMDTLLSGRQQDARQSQEYLELIAKENERLSGLIDNFLTFSRMERKKAVFDFAEVRPEAAVAEAVRAVRERFDAGGFTLAVEVPAGLPAIRADRAALTTVLINLLDNAQKYSGNARDVTVRVRADGAGVAFEVADHGIGLSRRDLKRIWDRFYQVDQTLARQVGGCGLGLNIVKYVVEAHGGRVEVQSQAGEGSAFRIWIPVQSEEDHGR